MAALSAALVALATGTQYFGQRAQATAAEQQGQYDRTAAQQNAQLAEWQAEDAARRGEEAVRTKAGETRQAVGAARAAGGASGVSGPSDVLSNQLTSLGAFDSITLRNNAAREAWGYRVNAQQARDQGELAAFAGRRTASALRNQAFGTLLTGAVALKGQYDQYRRDQGK